MEKSLKHAQGTSIADMANKKSQPPKIIDGWLLEYGGDEET